jgi:hypothetical protein
VFTALVTNIKLKYDKKGGLMAYIGMIDGGLRYLQVMCFASVWIDARTHFRVGRLLKLEVERQPDKWRGWTYIYNGGKIHWFKTADTESGTLASAPGRAFDTPLTDAGADDDIPF